LPSGTRWIATAVLAACAFALLGFAPAHAQPADTLSIDRPPRVLVFNPDTPDRCEWFFVTEFSTSYVPMATVDGYDNFLFDDSFGLMKNAGSHTAVGASMSFLLAQGEIHYTPTVRYKRWLGTRSVDVTLGYAAGELQGPTGPILTARYSPTRWFHMQAGACRIREVRYLDYPEFSVEERRPIRMFAGVGFGGVAGVGLWAAQAVGIVILTSLYLAAE
jgi:hypothetical protein